jgi:hypothetical protein
MIYLVYTSRATRPFAEKDLLGLLNQSKVNNERAGITGLLLYNNGVFMQLLEGQEEAVHSCYQRIRNDPRHKDVIQLVEKPLRLRYFDRWTMAFENLSNPDPSKVDGFNSFLSRPFSPQDLGSNLHEGLFLLLSFKKTAASMKP